MGFVFTRAGVLCIRHSRSTRRGNESNGAVIRSPGDYKSHMNKNGIYGGEAELAAAADIFKICLIMYREEQIHPHRIGSQNETQLSLLFTGDGDSGHFDVLQNQNKIQISKGQPGFTMTMEKGEVSSSRQGDEDGGWSEVSQKKEENKIVPFRRHSLLDHVQPVSLALQADWPTRFLSLSANKMQSDSVFE
ncbi:uncharacterized protein [Neodiprion pinetum]|uniref:uncharacterized protein isoform X3 n=1 Tax=Neodiprion pinetum TaxID=441929 RepID=UPI0037175F23